MEFSGWEKLSLLDFDDHISTTLFTSGCNMRCPFCHNSSLVLTPNENPQIPWEEIMAFLEKRKNVIDAVVVTGGEPTLMGDLIPKLSDIKSLGYKVKLDTNGTRPEVLRLAVEQGLVDYVAMDIKNCKEKYQATSGMKNLRISDINESIRYLIKGNIPYEFRTTTIEEFHTENDFELIGQWVEGAERFFIQRYVDRDGCIEHGFHEVKKEKALILKAILSKYVKQVKLRGYD